MVWNKREDISAQSATGKIAAAFGLQIATLSQKQNHNSNYINDSKKKKMHITKNATAETGVLLKKSVPGIEVALLWGANVWLANVLLSRRIRQ